MKNAVLFDLGNTLVHYYESSESPDIIREAVGEVRAYLQEEGILDVSDDELWAAVEKENYEAEDCRVRPLEHRLTRIFHLGKHGQTVHLLAAVCRRFMRPIFALGRRYDDVLPALKELRAEGVRTGLASNTPWGSPADLWREEIERLELTPHFDAVVFCRDVGWRKPEKRIFEFALEKLNARPQDCVFVGDHPRWDVAGPRAVGMLPLLIDRTGTGTGADGTTIQDLHELGDQLRRQDRTTL